MLVAFVVGDSEEDSWAVWEGRGKGEASEESVFGNHFAEALAFSRGVFGTRLEIELQAMEED